MILFILSFTIVFLIFIELYVGSISLRRNSDNILVVNLCSGIHFLLHPFHNRFLWNREALVMNYPFMLSMAVIINLILKRS